jgi:trehalose/maltose hydrolase-like predicted phosphorylase
MANIGGTFLLLAYGLMGIRLGEKLCVAPVKQKAFRDVRLDIIYQGVSIVMQIKGETLTIHVSEPLTICLYGKHVHVNDVTSVLIKSLD